MVIPADKVALLRKEFPPEAVGKLPKGGVELDYVGHAAVTDRLLQVDPEWSWEPMATDDHGLPMRDDGKNLWIRLTVCGVTRIGVGDGKSAKECIGDAIRNAAMRFGVALDLWSKEELEQGSPKATRKKAEAPPAEQGTTRKMSRPQSDTALSPAEKMMFALLGQTKRKDKQVALDYISQVVDRTITSRTDLKPDELSLVIKSLEAEIEGEPHEA